MRLRRAPQDVYVGLDLSPGRIKVVALLPGPDGPTVALAADRVLAAGAGTASTRFDSAAVGAAVAGMLSGARLRAAGAALVLGPAEGVARRMNLVAQERPQMLAALTLQLGQALGTDVVAPRVGFVPLASAAEPGRLPVFAAAARQDAVAAQQRAVAAAGWRQGPVSTTAVALVNAWRACRPEDAADRDVVLLHVGHSAALWMVMEGSDPVALDAPLVGLALLRERPGTRWPDGAQELPSVPPALLAEWAGRLRQEIARGLQPGRREGAREEARPSEVWVTGGGARVPGFVDALGAALGVPVRAFDPLASLPAAEHGTEVFGPALVPALGGALQALAAATGEPEGLVEIDLRIPSDERPAAGRIALRDLARTAARDRGYHAILAASAVLLACSSYLHARVARSAADLDARAVQVTVDSASLAATMSRSQLLQERRRGAGAQVDAARELEAGRDAWPRVMASIAAAVPPSAWVSEVAAEADEAPGSERRYRVLGYAAAERDAAAFARALSAGGATGRVVRTQAVRIGRAAAVRFEVEVHAPAGAGGSR